MKKRVAVGIALPILLGTMIYLVFSPEAYVTQAFWRVIRVENPFVGIRLSEMPWGIKMMRYYLCDFLWAVALFQAVILILGEEKILVGALIGTVFCIGCEFAQMTDFFPGTFDVWDLVMEGIAGLAVILIYLRKWRIKEYEKGNFHDCCTGRVRSHGAGEWYRYVKEHEVYR